MPPVYCPYLTKQCHTDVSYRLRPTITFRKILSYADFVAAQIKQICPSKNIHTEPCYKIRHIGGTDGLF